MSVVGWCCWWCGWVGHSKVCYGDQPFLVTPMMETIGFFRPNLERVWKIKPQGILLNAFSASNDRNTEGIFVDSIFARIFNMHLVPLRTVFLWLNPLGLGFIMWGELLKLV